MNKNSFWLAIFLSVVSLFSYTLSDAERAYVAKNWPVANAAYAEVCPTLSGSEQIACSYWQILALSQTGKSREFQSAGKMLDSLLAAISPRDTLYSDLVMTRAQFEIYLKKYAKARETLRHAIEVSSEMKKPILQQICVLLEKSDPCEETKVLCLALQDSAKLDSIKVLKDSVSKAKTDSTTKIEVIKDSSKTSANVEVSVQSENVVSLEADVYVLQLGAFSKKENALALVEALASRHIQTEIVERTSSERTLFLVWTKESFSIDEAKKYGERVFIPLKMEYSAVKKD